MVNELLGLRACCAKGQGTVDGMGGGGFSQNVLLSNSVLQQHACHGAMAGQDGGGARGFESVNTLIARCEESR